MIKTTIDTDLSTWEPVTIMAPVLPVGTVMSVAGFGRGMVASSVVRVDSEANVTQVVIIR